MRSFASTSIHTGSTHLIDGHNLYEPQQMREWGFTYHAIGRSSGLEVALEVSAQ
ncbi:hypothetical protein [Paraburkholderia haematera]|uniref:Uncharacterized protein n=1 Tax=Paraburkholderia haematera TaxID=2793077 RepID=A0ABN7LG53_9BURK|nr:hypothetical protein [Paraburkholderia haematera]CAE6741190.1 hypothetical protein R69888_02521 [Paraburkholderia haematera]